ncbi:MAG: Fic family protein [Candidatus Tectomicrobia bacterium]|uniref:Fic family protein n=1 Tax=Tectimicrobiota bacterium TaxID=2528274 RepID=A0A933GM29_UNCTE|nr:Fic family protein [Candidatus Tectomicrobia bacterium]
MFIRKTEEIDALQKGINQFRPLSSHALKQLKEYYRIGLTYTSNALEGNSLTETETRIVLEEGITIGGKPLKDHFEAIGHSEAYDHLYKLAGKAVITERDLLELHILFYYRIDRESAGVYRKVPVIIAGVDVQFPPPSKIKPLMQAFIKEIPVLKETHHAVEYAALLHLKLVAIHPFIDGNGRIARLLMNLALLQTGYVITLIPPVMRNEYLESLKAGNRGDNSRFLNLILNLVYESQKEYLRLLRTLHEV